jgi:carbamoyl-phosphate synthase/aspartate carbamoyltransferase/dihydroorotase/carbamoyl-phosphate synthase/aspartate carbamoyltransferase
LLIGLFYAHRKIGRRFGIRSQLKNRFLHNRKHKKPQETHYKSAYLANLEPNPAKEIQNRINKEKMMSKSHNTTSINNLTAGKPLTLTADKPSTPSTSLPQVSGHPINLHEEDILSVDQFGTDRLEYIFDLARQMRRIVEEKGGTDILNGRVLACLFYEPSTRTSSSFISAMERLGGSVIPITQGVQFSSVSKGESLPDTIRTLEQYSDVIVLRHPDIGSAKVAADYAHIPVINAGDGPGEHPTQALLDLFTIREELGRIDGLKIAMVGDLRYGRTVHSLTKLLLHYDVSLRFVSPEILRLPLKIMNQVIDAKMKVRETHDVADVIENADVLYVTRVQTERFSDLTQYESVKNHYEITPELMAEAKEKMVVMHPLPRVGEIHYGVDNDPRAAYFRQVRNGMFIRMAILASVLGKV